MAINQFETQYDVTAKSKIKRFYETNKIFIFSAILILIILIGSFNFYFNYKEKQRVKFSENYVKAKIYLEEGKKSEALNLLKRVIYSNDPTYSTLCFFLVINQNLITDHSELSKLFNHLLENNKFEEEVRNLLIFKKALYNSNFVNESELLDEVKPLVNNESLWKPHALMLLGDYFLSKKENLKAKEFYLQILNTKGLQKDFYEHAKFKISNISNDK